MRVLFKLNLSGLLVLMMSILLSGCVDPSNTRENILLAEPSQGFVTVKEGNLFYQTFGYGDPIIILHGSPCDQGYLLPHMLDLAKDHQVTLYDQRGSGKSVDASVDDKMITVTQFVEDLERVRKKLGCERFTLIGHSWGGFLGMHYSFAYPNRLNALILLNSVSATSDGYKATLDQYNKTTAPLKTRMDKIQNSPQFKQGNTELAEELFRLMLLDYFAKKEDTQKLRLSFTPESAKNSFKINDLFAENYLTKFYDLRKNLQKSTIPTLIIHGDKDLFPTWTAQEIHNSTPNSTLVILKDCGHFSFIEQPDRLFEEIRHFLSKGYP